MNISSETGRSVCTAEGMAEFCDCSRVLFEPGCDIADNGGDHGWCNFCFFGFISIPHSEGRESILFAHVIYFNQAMVQPMFLQAWENLITCYLMFFDVYNCDIHPITNLVSNINL